MFSVISKNVIKYFINLDFKILKNLFCIIFIFFINIASCFANEELYFIKKNEVFLENTGNVLELRENAKKIAFQKALNILAKNILDPQDFLTFTQISDYKLIDLINDYKIESEKISDINYFAEISVNFNQKKVRGFFDKNNIKLNIFVSESYLIFPVYKKSKTIYLWDKDNLFYDNLINEYDQQSLLKLYFPKKNHINRLKISADHIISKNSEKINEFLDFYKKKKAIVIFLEENFEMNENVFKTKLEASLFSNNTFSNIQIDSNNLKSNQGTSSEIELIAKLVINELQNWWKNQIDLEDAEVDLKDLILVVVDTQDFKKSFQVEEILFQIFGSQNIRIKEIREKDTVFEISTNYSINHINLGLQSKNLKLIKDVEEKNIFLIESY